MQQKRVQQSATKKSVIRKKCNMKNAQREKKSNMKKVARVKHGQKRAYRNSLTLDTRVGRWTLDARLWTLDSGRWNLDAGLWTLDPGR